MAGLTTEQLEAIRKRVEEAREYGHGVGGIVFEDVPALLAEVEILEASYEKRLRRAYDTIAELQAELEKSEDALREIDTHVRSTPEPIPYITQTLRRVFPGYEGGDSK